MILNNQEFILGLIWRRFDQHLPTDNFFGKSVSQFLVPTVPWLNVKNQKHLFL